jgi:hypothetical protein
LLKHEFEDELILLGVIGVDVAICTGLYWPALGPIGATLEIGQGLVPLYVTAGSLVGKLHHRPLNDEEWEMARYIFRDSLYDRDDIILTNLAGSGGRGFTYPISTVGPVLVNLGHSYLHDKTTIDGPLLFHELTHVWQVKRRLLREVFFYDAVPEAIADSAYYFTPGSQWSGYRTEQQAAIVEAWTRGATKHEAIGFDDGARHKLTINSPLFRYINGNVRRSNNGASTGSGRSARQLLADGHHRTMKHMLHPKPPTVWWK